MIVKYMGNVFAAADEYTRDLKESFEKIEENIFIAQQKQKQAANKHRRQLVFKEDDWVLLKFLRHALMSPRARKSKSAQ